MSQILRTPDDRFENLPGFPFEPKYTTVDGLRIHHVDEGPETGEVVLMLHGEPSWAYLYRFMIPVFTEAGYRAIAPDLPGFGRSDKYDDRSVYTYEKYVGWMLDWLTQLDLTQITLVCQDWGSLIGLRLVAAVPDRFARIVLANGGLPTGDQKMPDAFMKWQSFSQKVPVFSVGNIINGGTTTDLSEEIIAAYDAPFPDESYKEAARIMPALVPTTPDDPSAEPNRDAWKVLSQFDKPFLTAFSDQDPVTRGTDRYFQKLVKGASGQPHTTIEGGGHFLQEDRGPELAQVVVDFMKETG